MNEKSYPSQPGALPPGLGKPAQRALAGANIHNLNALSQFSETAIQQLHGIGPNAMRQLQQALESCGLGFRS